MLELLRSIPGPQFLALFPLLVMSGILVGRFLINSGQSGLRMPEPAAFPPSTVASLRGGWELVLKTTIFSLWQRGIIELTSEAGADTDKTIRIFGREILRTPAKKADTYVFRRVEGIPVPAERIEMAVWNFLKTGRRPGDFFQDTTLQSFVDIHVRQAQQELERKGLLRSPDQRRHAWLVFLTVFAIVEGIGVTKLLLGIANNRPVGFLSAMLVIALIAFSIALKPSSRITPLGKAFLKRMEEHFEWLKEAVKGKESRGIDPAYAFAIFGTSVLAGTLLYSSFGEAFPGKTPGGCGGSSCGGSSCSGGGCSGGGCGGCGGGGD